MRRSHPLRRLARYSLRSALIGVTAAALLFSYLDDSARAYERQRHALAQLPNVPLPDATPLNISFL